MALARRSSQAARQASSSHPAKLIRGTKPFYSTELGSLFCGDSAGLLGKIPDDSVDLVVTSPPYALHFQKEYGNVTKAEYVDWFRVFGEQIHRALKPTGSFVLNIGGSYNAGTPTRSLYHFRLLLMLCDAVGFHLAQECFWYNPAKLPAPAEWVTVRRERIKDSVEYVFWLSKKPHPKANNRHVLVDYSPDMLRLIKKGYRAKERPSGHKLTGKFQNHRGGAIPSNFLEAEAPEEDRVPSNVLVRGNNESNSAYIKRTAEQGQKAHPARYPARIPEFFTQMLTDEGDLVVDPFAGSNTTGFVAEGLNRKWLGFESREDYAANSKLRFDNLI